MRLFLAVELPDAMRTAINEVQARLRARLPGWRWVPPASVHLTLRFLGESPADAPARHGKEWERAASSSSPIRFAVRDCGVFPDSRRPRVLWVGIRDAEPQGALEDLAAALEEGARRLGYSPERRGFRPHLTIARAARDRSPTVPGREEVGNLGVVEVAEVVLLRSELLPSGARYHVEGRYPLGGPESPR